jgi:DNA-binding CsgD family transcriptional regulator
VARFDRLNDGRAHMISDCVSQRDFHRLALYNEFYRRIGTEEQVALTLPSPRPGLIVALALSRDRRSFQARDRTALNAVGPHLEQAYRTARTVDELERRVDMLGAALASSGRAALCVDARGRITDATPLALEWLAEYVGCDAAAGRLPDAVERWRRAQLARLAARADDVPAALDPLRAERPGTRLEIRILPGESGSRLLLSRTRTGLDPAVLKRLGLTDREAEVLAWLARGKTNEEIAEILGTRPRTVGKHLERVFAKLGVETRTAAAARALTAARDAEAGRP